MTVHLGLLVCDHVPDGFEAALGGTYADAFTHLFDACATDVSIHPFPVIDGEFPQNITAMDGWIITGSRFFVTDETPWIHRLSDLIRTMHGTVPVVGICFGHQLIAHALGGTAGPSKQGRIIGNQQTYVVELEPWMDPPLETVRLLYSHRDQIETLPPDARVLAGSPQCPVGIVVVGETTVGLQGHPEFTREFTDAIITMREDELGPEAAARARASLDGPTDEATVARWIVNLAGG